MTPTSDSDSSRTPPAETGRPVEFDRLAVITIQGGGIYGLNLLGQLSYLTERLKIIPVAVAGNSAGSIVATLFWAGYTPWEIRDIFADMAAKRQLAGLVGPFEPPNRPFKISHFRSIRDDCIQLVEQLGGDESRSRWRRAWRTLGTPFRFCGLIWTLRRLRNQITPHDVNRGCFQGDAFTEMIDHLIRNGPQFKNRTLPQGRLLEFKDVRELIENDQTFNPPALFITATNVTGRKLEVFNSIDPKYHHVPIAKAVRASAGFPFFFRPTEFKDTAFAGWYADGGIVSNYPAWIFSKEFRIRLLESPEYRPLAARPWAHFGLRLERAPVDGDPLNTSPKLYFESLGRLLLVGEARSELENRLANLVTRSFIVQQPTSDTGVPPDLDLLDVDKVTPKIVKAMYQCGRNAGDRLGELHYALPDRAQIEQPLTTLINRALLVLSQVDSSGKPDNSKILFRSNVFIPSRGTLYIQYAVNMKGDPDENFSLRFDAGLTGFCFSLRRPLICNLEKIGNLHKENKELLNNLFGMTADQHEQVRKDRTWLASIPIFDPLASYPRDLHSGQVPYQAAFYHSLSGRTDGAILGVLNLDAKILYSPMGLDPDPKVHWTDPRIEAILHLMTATSAEIGHILSQYFAKQ
ncbi:MAG TPA: patatin-like phospholipase family protein [Gemmata sp.]|jgi:predicted acylesterase/phospholipase RssA|nr:patatin-like phospholipase family protein [Gemmata sp.]